MELKAVVLLMSANIVICQRPSFAGIEPIGYPDTPNRTAIDSLADRFGDGITEKLPIQANGDRELIDRLSKLPIDKQPFWFINWQVIEAHKEKPQTYPQRPSIFAVPVSNPGNNNQNVPNTNANPALSNRNGFDSNVNFNQSKLTAVMPAIPETQAVTETTVPPKQIKDSLGFEGNDFY